MPVMGYHHFKEKKKWISGENIDIQPVSTAAHWPYKTSKWLGYDFRMNLLKLWKGLERPLKIREDLLPDSPNTLQSTFVQSYDHSISLFFAFCG
ncbi:uncharacterized protein RHIMIDRAFT_266004 [Rhizopus microsporus ATCC 52813]|uniref:Uncharacterized protein n=1 Tax=Rhizopus microsporus ATCC 52813 TaxID=1340429 RepID=A0A2G4T5W8_RHIZD|nr:uncharacterized protein RHIMIDRAFT_266004 [Rhizopus microsporus ATCC 52813]PHZ16398.1 hypothetical protein RHIMIDRAFT_266004 [Rhizopus microsporus ATCC 52813]